MPFNRLGLYVSRKAVMPTKYLHTGAIDMRYSSFLKGESFAGYHSINLFLTNLASEVGTVLRQGRFITFYTLFDFQAFAQLEPPLERKRYLLEFIQASMLRLAHQEGWSTERFDRAYQGCLDCGLRVEWNFRGRLFRSPDRAHYFALFHHVDFEQYEVAEVLYDKHKQEIFRRTCFVDTGPVFSVQWAAWEDSTRFSYRFGGPKRVFTAEVAELLQHREYQTSRRQRDLF
ncbi:hypothetical protein [Hymenobacter terricola]|uniref:hypothetical protein n=1 Tax=Hymenobacter terricola TaxID=2819236 RepID=UPI001B308596|nr:hypothetical protein [Hymenobacter terricola]